MNQTEFLSVIYSGIKPGLVIQTKDSRSQIIGIDTKGNVEYLLQNSYKKTIAEDEWVSVYSELSKGRITNSQISEIVGASRTCNAAVIKWMLTKFGLAVQAKKNVWISTWQWESVLTFNENVSQALLDSSGNIVRVNNAWEKFALSNDGGFDLSNGVGINYLDVCASSVGQYSSDAMRAYDGIQSVNNGSKNIYTQHYTCHSEDEYRWFVMFAWRFADRYIRVSQVGLEY